MKKDTPKLGQHFLKDDHYLIEIVDSADITLSDTVLEIGPGQGDLTRHLAKKAQNLVCVELDSELAKKLQGQVANNVDIVNQDIRDFVLGSLPKGYKVVANIPYYISGEIVKLLLESDNPPSQITLLVQKEVAERVAAQPGDMSVLSITSQFFADVELGPQVPADAFTPPPEVDSQVVVLRSREEPIILVDQDKFFKLVKQAFSMKRKKLSNSLSAYEDSKTILSKLDLADKRPQELNFKQWEELYNEIYN